MRAAGAGFFVAGVFAAGDFVAGAAVDFFAAGRAAVFAEPVDGVFVARLRAVGAGSLAVRRVVALLRAGFDGVRPARSAMSANASSSVMASARSRSGIVAFTSPCLT